jgi:hypothetical protein
MDGHVDEYVHLYVVVGPAVTVATSKITYRHPGVVEHLVRHFEPKSDVVPAAVKTGNPGTCELEEQVASGYTRTLTFDATVPELTKSVLIISRW